MAYTALTLQELPTDADHPKMPTLYEVLGLPTTATTTEINSAYRRLARNCHPDKCPHDPSAHERFIRLKKAHTMLRNLHKRCAYDIKTFGFRSPLMRNYPNPTRRMDIPESPQTPWERLYHTEGKLLLLKHTFCTIYRRYEILIPKNDVEFWLALAPLIDCILHLAQIIYRLKLGEIELTEEKVDMMSMKLTDVDDLLTILHTCLGRMDPVLAGVVRRKAWEGAVAALSYASEDLFQFPSEYDF